MVREPGTQTITVVIPTLPDRDESRAVASASDADEVLVFENTDGSPSKSINHAIDTATSEWLVVLADDDFLMPGAIENMKRYLDGDFIFSDIYLADESGAIRGVCQYPDRPTDPAALIEYVRVKRYGPVPMTGPWRISWLRENALRFIEWPSTGYADDCRTLLEWMKHSPGVRYIPGPFHAYVQHDGQTSRESVERDKFLSDMDAYFKGE